MFGERSGSIWGLAGIWRCARSVVVWLVLLTALVSGVVQARQNGGVPPQTIRFINGQWFDGQQFVRGDWYAVNGRLTKRPPETVEVVEDLRDGYVVPPFGEAHNHNLEGRWDFDKVVGRYVQDGVLYVKNPNDVWEFARQILPRLNQPATLDAVFAHAGLTSSGGHPGPLYEHVLREARYRPAVGDLPAGWFEGRGYLILDHAADLDRQWPKIVAHKPDFVKIYLAHSEWSGESPRAGHLSARKGLNPDLVPLIVARSHREGLRVAAHVETAEDFRTAVSAGVDEVAHVPGWYIDDLEETPRLRLTEEDARAAARAGVVVATTTVAMKPAAVGHGETGHHAPAQPGSAGHHPPAPSMTMAQAAWEEAERLQVHNLRLLHQQGVILVIGSDHAPTSLDEVMHLHALGLFDNVTLLRMWCEATPRSIFPARSIGRLQEGYEASVLVLADNPIERFSAVTKILRRMKQGRWIEGSN